MKIEYIMDRWNFKKIVHLLSSKFNYVNMLGYFIIKNEQFVLDDPVVKNR